MKRLILSASLAAIAMTLLTPTVLARQLSTPGELSEGATIHQLVLHNRDMRTK